jgi:hypothetical protein
MKNQAMQLQQIVLDYFKDVEDELFLKIVDSFVYDQGTNDKKVSSKLEAFIKENELEQIVLDYHWNRNNPKAFFIRNAGGMEMYENIKVGFMNAWINRSISGAKLDTKLEKAKTKLNKANLKYATFHALECFESLHRSEQYFYSKEEDLKIVEILAKIKWEQ